MDIEIFGELEKKLNLKEKILIRVFKKYTYKIYNITRIYITNNWIK